MTPRPVARRQPEAAPDARLRPAIRSFSASSASLAIEWDVRPVYDFLFSLSNDVGTTDDLPEDDRRWLADARASLPEADRASVARHFETNLCVLVGSVAVEAPEARDIASLLDRIEATDPIDLIRAILSDFVHDPETVRLFDRLAAGDDEARDLIVERVPEYQDGFRAMLADPLAAKAEVVSILRAWEVVFRPIEDRIRGIIERDFSLRAAERDALAGVDLIERVTGGIRWLPEPGVERVVLAPVYFIRPYNFVLAGGDWRFFGYPVSDSAVQRDPLAPAPGLLRVHRALGDATRLRILKLLAGQDLYLTEIAVQLDLTKPTIKHHLALLRAAGLVTVVNEGAMTYYSLRRERLDDAAVELKGYLVD
jgi:DNA-binding transcriptional ArsR family regulator